MAKYICPCGYIYDPELGDPENGVAPGTAWEDVPEDWVCPTCGLGKDVFEEEKLRKKAKERYEPFLFCFNSELYRKRRFCLI